MKLIKNKWYLVEYEDASYSYEEILSVEDNIPPPVVSVGFLYDFDEDYINLGLIINNIDKKPKEGLIIPRKTILRLKILEYEQK